MGKRKSSKKPQAKIKQVLGPSTSSSPATRPVSRSCSDEPGTLHAPEQTNPSDACSAPDRAPSPARCELSPPVSPPRLAPP